MRVDVAITVDAPAGDVWKLVADIEHAWQNLSAVEEIEVLERPPHGLKGLKWKETRTMYGKSATETMWITDVDEGSYYTTEARSHGSIYRTDVRVEEADGGTRLSMAFTAEAETPAARIVSAFFGYLIKRSVRKALEKDLEEVKSAAESRQPARATGPREGEP